MPSASKRLRHDRRTDAIVFEDSRAVDSTKGSSAGGVAGDGPMAATGRAPMLPVDYSFFELENRVTRFAAIGLSLQFRRHPR
jgi:hypothetical protein